MDADHEDHLPQQSEDQHHHVSGAVMVPSNGMVADSRLNVGPAPLPGWPRQLLPLVGDHHHLHLRPQQRQNQHDRVAATTAALFTQNWMAATGGGVQARPRARVDLAGPGGDLPLLNGFGRREYFHIRRVAHDVEHARNIIADAFMNRLGPENTPCAGRLWVVPIPERPNAVGISIVMWTAPDVVDHNSSPMLIYPGPESNPCPLPRPMRMPHISEESPPERNVHNNRGAHNPFPPPLRLNWAEVMIVYSLAAAIQMTQKLETDAAGRGGRSSSSSSSTPDPVGAFQSRYGYPFAILLCFAFVAAGHLIGGVYRRYPLVATVATRSGIFLGTVGFLLALTTNFPNHVKFVTWACAAVFMLAVAAFLCRRR